MEANQQPTALATTSPAVFNFFDPEQFATMQRVCKMFASSELVPDMYRESEKNPANKAMANCMIAINISMRIGADPLMVMQNLVIIHGRPSWSSKFLIATVNTCGRFNPLQYRFTEKGGLGKVEYTEYEKKWQDNKNGGKGFYKNEAKTIVFDGTKMNDIECVAWTTKKGSTEILESAPITIRMAVKEGWYTKAGSKWQTMERQMLMYRAGSFWTNIHAPELSMGMKTVEEVLDIEETEDITHEDVTEKVNQEVKEKANAGTMSFDNAAEKPTSQANTATPPPPTTTQQTTTNQAQPSF